jgi:class I fructose-bisphosphate aldolase
VDITTQIKNFLKKYEGEPTGVKLNLARLFMHGNLAGTGRLILLAVDQGFEYGPTTFFKNQEGFSPHYHFKMAKNSKVSAYIAPLNWLRAGIETFLGEVPLILKINHSSKLFPKNCDPNQAQVATVQDALELGCIGVGFTLYPGSNFFAEQLEELQELSSQARRNGLFTVVWAYPRGSEISKTSPVSLDGHSLEKVKPEIAIDTIAYSTHMACLAGAHIVKANIPGNFVSSKDAINFYKDMKINTLKDRIKHIVDCCFSGGRAVLFSGGVIKSKEELFEEIHAIKEGGGMGSIIGRNIFQRPEEEALQLVKEMAEIYTSP